MPIKFLAMDTSIVRTLQAGGCDANNMIPEKVMATETIGICRHCLKDIVAGEEMLILSHRPFQAAQPYAEQGPIFLHAEPCERFEETPQPPTNFLERDYLMIRGYTGDERIKYGTGKVVDTGALVEGCRAILEDPEIEYIHVRSASNNCYQCRVERG